jgi:hypothetical protein
MRSMRVPPWVLATAGAAALAGATVLARPHPPESSPLVLAVPAERASVGASAADWTAVVRALDAARLAGYADPLTADPGRWADPSCGCLAVERSRLDRLLHAGRSVRGTAPALRDVRALSVEGDRATVEVTDVIAAYDVVEAGRPVQRYAGRGPLTWRGVLIRHGGGWRWADLRAAGHDPAPGVDRGGRG